MTEQLSDINLCSGSLWNIFQSALSSLVEVLPQGDVNNYSNLLIFAVFINFSTKMMQWLIAMLKTFLKLSV